MDIKRAQHLQGWAAIPVWLGLTLLAAACSQQQGRPPDPRPTRTGSSRQAGYDLAARRALGDGAQVMLSGDLAHDGHIQLLVANRLPGTSSGAPGRVFVSRAAILERDGDEWREIFLADDHLKNGMGFLQGTPVGSASSWQLRYQQGKDGLTMLFTPMQQPAGSVSATVEVRWNPRNQRYQSFDRRSGGFLAEISTPEGTPSFRMKR